MEYEEWAQIHLNHKEFELNVMSHILVYAQLEHQKRVGKTQPLWNLGIVYFL